MRRPSDCNSTCRLWDLAMDIAEAVEQAGTTLSKMKIQRAAEATRNAMFILVKEAPQVKATQAIPLIKGDRLNFRERWLAGKYGTMEWKLSGKFSNPGSPPLYRRRYKKFLYFMPKAGLSADVGLKFDYGRTGAMADVEQAGTFTKTRSYAMRQGGRTQNQIFKKKYTYHRKPRPWRIRALETGLRVIKD